MDRAVTAPIETATRRADEAVARGRDNPQGRLARARRFDDHPFVEGARPYGRAELAFLEWEVRRGVLTPVDGDHPGSPWWRTVNEHILRDAAEAEILCREAVDIATAGPNVARWMRFLGNPNPVTFYVAHNASVVEGYFAAAPLAVAETAAERTLMNLTLARVLFVQVMTASPRLVLGRFGSLGRAIATPRGDLVSLVMRRPDLYPDHYVLTAEDQRRVRERVYSVGGEVAAFVDDVLLAPRLHLVYATAASAIAQPRLLHLLDAGRPCYPWRLADNGAAPDRNDPWPHPHPFAGLVGWLLSPLLGLPSRKGSS